MSTNLSRPTKNERIEPTGGDLKEGMPAPEFLSELTRSLAYVPGNTLVADANGVIRYVSPQALAALGYAKADMIGQNITSFWDQPGKTSQKILARLELHHFWQGEIRHRLKRNGGKENDNGYWELVSLSIVQGADADESYIVKIGLPIHPDKHDDLETRLGQSEMDRQALLDTSPFVITIFRLSDRKILDVNRRFCLRTGYSRQETLGRTSIELGLFKRLADRERFVQRFEQDSLVDDMEIQFVSKSGEIIDAIISARLIEYRGEACGITTSMDVTELRKVQRELQESELRYRTIMEAAPDPITLTRLSDGKIIQTNTAFHQRTGWRPEETIGRTTTELNIYINPADRDRFVEILKSQGKVDAFQLPVRFKDGTTSVDMWAGRIIDVLGEPHLVVVTRDIGELYATQKALEESELNYRTILEMSPNAISVTRLSDLRHLLVNEAFARNTGYSQHEAVGRRAVDLKLFADRALADRFLEIFLSQGHVDGMELQLRKKNGDITENLISARPIQYGDEPCILAISTNIDTLKAIQRALSEREANYRAILETAPYSIIISRLSDGVCVEVNQACCRRVGFSREEIIGKTPVGLNFYKNPADRERLYEALRRDGLVMGMEIEYLSKDGTELKNLVSAARIKYNGEDCLLAITVDIGKLKAAEDALRRNEQHLEQIVRERTKKLESAQNELVKREKLSVLGQLTATVSHELRNPLAVIKSSNFFLKQKFGGKDEKTNKHLKRIDDQLNLCDLIIADLLEYTRGRNIELEKQPITPWLEQVIQQLAETENIAIETKLSPTLPPVPHDQEKMRRVCINLIENAVHAVRAQARTEAAEVYKPSICVTTTRQGNEVVIEVRDNGVGMDEATCERAFEPLFTTRAQGTGIGLANVRKIVKEHKGAVVLDSKPGKGTTVTVKLQCTLDAKELPLERKERRSRDDQSGKPDPE